MDTTKLLKQLVRIPSVFPNELRISQFLAQYLKNIGFTVELVKTKNKRNNIVSVFGKAKTYIGFYGHMDTVPRKEQKGVNPYNLTIQGKKAFGLGAEDMKGGISAILQMGEYAVENNLPVKILFGVDEEDISRGAHDLVDSGLLEDIRFLISAESGQIQNARQPYNVCYGRKGRVLFDLLIFGKKAHAAEKEKGINAIEQAIKILTLIQKIRFEKHNNLGSTTVVVHSIEGLTDSFSVPDKCRVLFSLLTSPFEKSTTFLEKIRTIAKQNSINIDIHPFKRETPYAESYEVAKGSFLDILENLFERDGVVPIYTASVADENIFANRLQIPVISIGPMGGGGHTDNEWVDLHSLKTIESLYKEIVAMYNH
ncbi:MAG: M20/M25/M40 family metallo-hydrolase [Candidatus Levybacteria bacterium]|nr:M20/M25/M40 family metallo-hydrolase [Candidatus Levybacteria bacterium]